MFNASKKLMDQGRDLIQEKGWKEKYEKIFREIREMMDSIKNDEQIQNLNEKAQKLVDNFTYVDAKGQRHLNQDLLSQMRTHIIPMFIQLLDQIPVPTIEGENSDYKYKLENITFSARDVIPDQILIRTGTDIDYNVTELRANQARSRALLKISNMKTKINGVKFWFKKKTFPELEDHGIADAAITGDGAAITVLLEIKPNDDSKYINFNVRRCRVRIDKLEITIKEAKHDILLKMGSTFFQRRIKKNIEKTIEKKVESTFKNIEETLNSAISKYSPSGVTSAIKENLMAAVAPPTQSDSKHVV